MKTREPKKKPLVLSPTQRKEIRLLLATILSDPKHPQHSAIRKLIREVVRDEVAGMSEYYKQQMERG